MKPPGTRPGQRRSSVHATSGAICHPKAHHGFGRLRLRGIIGVRRVPPRRYRPESPDARLPDGMKEGRKVRARMALTFRKSADQAKPPPLASSAWHRPAEPILPASSPMDEKS
jgi:hypothetical protein